MKLLKVNNGTVNVKYEICFRFHLVTDIERVTVILDLAGNNESFSLADDTVCGQMRRKLTRLKAVCSGRSLKSLENSQIAGTTVRRGETLEKIFLNDVLDNLCIHHK